MPFVVGETVGPYRILAKLGSGGMATVYKAYHPALDRYVAIKALHPAFMEDPNFLRRFQREARVVAKLEHPNIVPIYDFSSHEGRPYLVMKFIAGVTLKARLKDGPIGRRELLRITRAVGSALAYAHGQGILHRDVKPSNVLLADNGQVYLADFGLARIAQAGESTMSSDMMLGTPQYISPEQAMGLKDLDAGTDIYSLGVMLYELVVGRVPFSADTPFSIIHDHIYTPLPLPRQINAGVPEAVERVLLKALAKERRDRFPDVKSLVTAFVEAIDTERDGRVAAAEPQAIPGIEPLQTVTSEKLPEVEGMDSDGVGTPSQVSTEPPGESDQAGLLEEKVAFHDAKTVLKDRGSEPVPAGEQPVGRPIVPSTTPAKMEEKRRIWQRLRWWQSISLLVGGVVCCLLVFGVVVGGQRAQNKEVSRTTPQDSQLGEAATIQRALEWVQNNPEDPYAHLELAVLYWDNGQYARATEAFKKAFDLADGDTQVLMGMLDAMQERGIWTGIAVTLLAYQGSHPEDFTQELRLRLNEAVYFAAETPNYADVVPVKQLAAIHPGLEQVAKARNRLYQGEIEEAQAMLDRVFYQGSPVLPEALLLQAEIALNSGDQLLAREVLTELDAMDDLPEWIRAYMAFLWGNLGDESQVRGDLWLEAPDDPWALLEMLDASLAEGMGSEAETLIAQIQEIAGDDAQIYFFTGDILIKYELWDLAVPYYLRALELNPNPPGEWVERLHMATYYGGMSEQGLKTLINPAVNLGPELRLMVEARYEMYFGNLERAGRLVQQMLDEPPDLPEEPLLEAEFLLQKGDLAPAKEILAQIVDDRAVAYWIREAARTLLAEINP